MKRIVLFLLLVLILISCGTRSGHFKMEGRFLHMNQGELYVYSPDGGIDGLDTIKIEAGRFAYEIPCSKPATLVIIFPNYSVQPIFAESGGSVEVKADASHLKEMEVKGTDDNELMGKFRKETAVASPPEVVKEANRFVKEHPESPVSIYLTERYLINDRKANYKQIAELIRLMEKEQPKNGALARLTQYLRSLQNGSVGQPLPKFVTKDLNGNIITSSKLNGKNVIICTWVSWSDESKDILQTLNSAVKKKEAVVIGICLDPSAKSARQYIKENGIIFPNICDGEMLESKLIKTLGLTYIPDNIILNNGLKQ